MTYSLRIIIIAGNGPYFSHYFQFLCWKTQNPVSTTYGFRVLCLIHRCGVIHCRVKRVYPLIKLHLWCPRLKKDGHLRCGRGICHLFWWLFSLLPSAQDREKSDSLGRLFLPNHPLGWSLVVLLHDYFFLQVFNDCYQQKHILSAIKSKCH